MNESGLDDHFFKCIYCYNIVEIYKKVWVRLMCERKELSFSIFLIYSLANKWKLTPKKVYQILNTTGILDNYIIPCYDVLHTQGKEYLVEDITDYAREKGVKV